MFGILIFILKMQQQTHPLNLLCSGEERRQRMHLSFFSKNLSFHLCLAFWWTNELFPLSMQRAGLGGRSGLRVALAGKQITGLGRYHGFWSTRLWALHVLAQGAGPSDVVGDMWKLSWVYPAQPSLVPSGRESRHQDTETCVQTDKHGNLVSTFWYYVYILGS